MIFYSVSQPIEKNKVITMENQSGIYYILSEIILIKQYTKYYINGERAV